MKIIISSQVSDCFYRYFLKHDDQHINKLEPAQVRINTHDEQFQEISGLHAYYVLGVFFGCLGSLLLHTGFLQLRRAGATLRCGVQASHCGGFSCCGARALGTKASVVVALSLVTPWHVGSSWTRDRTHVPCIGRWIINHCATREVPMLIMLK